jgi:single-strand DNA-binding protein
MSIGDTNLTVVGNLTADPDLRFVPSGHAVVAFTVAASRRVFDQGSGQWKDADTLFLRCSAWRQLAEHVADSLTKGMRVIVSGRLKQREYETAEGEKRTVYEVDVEEVGPSLRYVTAKVAKVTRDRPPHPAEAASPAADPWSVPAGHTMAGVAADSAADAAKPPF